MDNRNSNGKTWADVAYALIQHEDAIGFAFFGVVVVLIVVAAISGVATKLWQPQSAARKQQECVQECDTLSTAPTAAAKQQL